jgi:hypothetical protein
MAKTSRIGAAEDALFGLLTARQAIGGAWSLPEVPGAKVELTLGHPGGDLQKQHVWIPGESTSDQVWETTIGQTGQKTETITLSVAVWVNLEALDYRENRDRALELAGEVELAVRDDFTLGTGADATVFQGEVTRHRVMAAIGDFGRACQVLVDVTVTSLLS